MSHSCPCYMEFLKGTNLLNAGLKHSRSNLIFEIFNNFSFEMFYCDEEIIERQLFANYSLLYSYSETSL